MGVDSLICDGVEDCEDEAKNLGGVMVRGGVGATGTGSGEADSGTAGMANDASGAAAVSISVNGVSVSPRASTLGCIGCPSPVAMTCPRAGGSSGLRRLNTVTPFA